MGYNDDRGVVMSDGLIERLEQSGLDIFAAEIVKGGETLLHYAPDGGKRHPVYSAAKSVTSAAFCIAWQEGLVSPEIPLCDFLEEHYRPLVSPQMKALPFSRFLTMTAGAYPFRPEGSDWLRTALSNDPDHSDAGFHYSNIPAYLVGAAVENAVGGDLMRFLRQRLFDPLGIPEFPYMRSPEGHFYGATGMELSARELALLGRLYLQEGRWNEHQLIARDKIKAAAAPRIPTGSGDSYGYFFRVGKDHFSMVGKWGQRCMVFPEKQLVIAYLSDQPERCDELYRAALLTAAGITPDV